MVTVGQLATGKPVTVEAGSSAIEAAKLMTAHQIGGVLVKRGDEIIGIVSEPDIVRKIVGADRGPYFMPVEEIMSEPVLTIDETRPVTEAADLMEQHRTLHLAVTRKGRIVALLSVRDLLHPVSIDEL